MRLHFITRFFVDNTTLNPGTLGDSIATNDIGGVKYQIVKNAFGAAGSVTPVSIANGLPTQIASLDGKPVGPRATYDFATTFTPGTAPTDILTITGSASKTIRVTRLRITATQTTAGVNTFFLLKRSTANTAGTSSAVTRVPRDSTNAAATATVLQYTVNPTAGTLVGNIRNRKLLTPAPASTFIDEIIWDFDDFQTHPCYLRGVAEVIAINFAGAALPAGLSVSISGTFTEE